MNLKALKYVSLGIQIPDFLFVVRGMRGDRFHEAFCTICKKFTEDWKFLEDEGSRYEEYVMVKCHNYKYRVPVIEGDLNRHQKLYMDIYSDKTNNNNI